MAKPDESRRFFYPQDEEEMHLLRKQSTTLICSVPQPDQSVTGHNTTQQYVGAAFYQPAEQVSCLKWWRSPGANNITETQPSWSSVLMGGSATSQALTKRI
jgi:hypothetical protein